MKLVKQIQSKVSSLALLLLTMAALSFLPAAPAFAAPIQGGAPSKGSTSSSSSSTIDCGSGSSDASLCQTDLPTDAASQGTLSKLLQIFFGILAVISVLMIVIGGGLRYIFSGDDPQSTSRAKSAIIYAIVGLVIAISGESIVSFVLNKLTL